MYHIKGMFAPVYRNKFYTSYAAMREVVLAMGEFCRWLDLATWLALCGSKRRYESALNDSESVFIHAYALIRKGEKAHELYVKLQESTGMWSKYSITMILSGYLQLILLDYSACLPGPSALNYVSWLCAQPRLKFDLLSALVVDRVLGVGEIEDDTTMRALHPHR